MIYSITVYCLEWAFVAYGAICTVFYPERIQERPDIREIKAILLTITKKVMYLVQMMFIVGTASFVYDDSDDSEDQKQPALDQ